MENTLETLWELLLEKLPPVLDAEENKRLSDRLRLLRNDLLETLSEEQRQLFMQYEDTLSEHDTFFSKESFIKGVRFGVSFMLEAQPKK